MKVFTRSRVPIVAPTRLPVKMLYRTFVAALGTWAFLVISSIVPEYIFDSNSFTLSLVFEM